jgi:hypothetical protein
MTQSASGQEIGRYFGDGQDPQMQVQVSVVIPTILRPCLEIALRSVFAQEGVGRIQILIGVDKPGDPQPLYRLLEKRPVNVSALVVALPYSTSVRHGGPHVATDGGGLRSILTFMANSRHVAYLDDDNSWEPNHLAGLLKAVQGKVWAFSHRLLIDEESGEPLAVDRWDSVGVGKGRFAAQGGLVDPNCLILDKVAAARVLGRWAETADGRPGVTADRHVFAALKDSAHGESPQATVRYGIRKTNVLHQLMARGIEF